MKKISIDELKPGMVVAGLIDKNQKMLVKQCGVVKSEKIIQDLKSKGIEQVMIKIEHASGTQEPLQEATKIINPIKKAQTQGHSQRLGNLQSVKALFSEAEVVQRNIAEKIQSNEPWDVAEIEDVAQKLVSAVLETEQSMWFMTRIHQQSPTLMEHSIDVAVILALFAKNLGFTEALIHDLLLGGFLHDVGKLMVPEKLINKKSNLTDAEQLIVKGHVLLSKELVESKYEHIPPVSLTALAAHHESFDGSGYPQALAGDDIPYYAKMLAIADRFAVLTAGHKHKKTVSNLNALRLIMLENGKAFDPQLVTPFIRFIGNYPPGTLALIASNNLQRLAIIIDTHPTDPLTPVVKSFFNVKTNNFLEIENINLASPHCSYEIKKSITAQEYNINMEELVDRCF